MNKGNIRKLIKLNISFYNKVSHDFSLSRSRNFRGWDNVSELLKKRFNNNTVSVLDVGCGNGRLYPYLNSVLPQLRYTGVDNNDFLITQASERYPKAVFISQDIFETRFKGYYDAVMGFGITHHIPDKEFRTQWIKYVTDNVDRGGFLILSFWNFNKDKSLEHEYSRFLEHNDYILGWKRTADTYRYCHLFDNNELGEIDSVLSTLGLNLVDNYNEDLNNYRIWQRLGR